VQLEAFDSRDACARKEHNIRVGVKFWEDLYPLLCSICLHLYIQANVTQTKHLFAYILVKLQVQMVNIIKVSGRIFNWYSGGVDSNWVHSALRPLIGLFCQPRIIMMMEKLVEWWLAGKQMYSEKTCPSAALFPTNPTWPERARTRAAAVGNQRLTAWATARPFREESADLFLVDGGKVCILLKLPTFRRKLIHP
jgi:hypothetical protein